MAAGDTRVAMIQGRIVWTAGDLFKGKVKLDQNTRQPKTGKNGEQMMEFGFGLAVPKAALNPGQQGADLWAAIYEEANKLYPSRQYPPAFAWKYKDGDGPDHNGVPFSQREGWAGCLVFSCTTSLPIKFFRYDEQARQNVMINEGIKCGDYVNVQLQIKAHPAQGQGKPGLYLNPNAVQFLGFGKEIINAPSGDQIFGLAAPPMPPGASAVPVAGPGILVPTGAMPGYPQAPAAPQYQQPPQPAQPPQPHYGVLPPVHQPPPGGMPAPAPQQWQQPANPMPPVGNAPPVMPGYPQAPAQAGPPVPPSAYPSNPMGNAPPVGFPASPGGGYPAPAAGPIPMAPSPGGFPGASNAAPSPYPPAPMQPGFYPQQ